MSFVRRFTSYPGTSVITQIEGVSIIDLTPPGPIIGAGSSVACVVGEFADMTNAVAISASGVVSTMPQAIEVFSSQDLINKMGGWDETIGEFGVSSGNAFSEIRNKTFGRLICVPVNLASAQGARMVRDLPTNRSATDATPIVPLQPVTVAAGREFKTGSNRVRSGKAVTFTNELAYLSAVDGAQVSNTGPAASATFNSAGSSFVNAGVAVGDILVLGVIGGSGLPGTYRVLTVASATQLTVERLDGANFTWAAVAALPFRLHVTSTADSAGTGNVASAIAGYKVPARPLDATITAAAILAPSTVPPAGTATSWDTLSGLALIAMPGGSGGLTYTAAVQAPNAVSAAALDALYALAIDSLLADLSPQNEINIVWAARKSANIAAKLKGHADTQSAQGVGRTCTISPPLDQVNLTVIGGDSYPGVGGNRSERIDYAWPAAKTFIPEAVGFPIKCADGVLRSDGLLDIPFDSWETSVLSAVNPERNPGEASPTTKKALQGILGYARGTPNLGLAEYTFLRAKGVAGLRIDRTSGPVIQSGITSSLKSGEKNINRRRMADFIEDSLAVELIEFNKLPIDAVFIDGVISQTTAFMEGLLSVNNPPAQRIRGYLLDIKSGNTPALEASGIFVIIVNTKMLATADFIVAQCAVGTGVEV